MIDDTYYGVALYTQFPLYNNIMMIWVQYLHTVSQQWGKLCLMLAVLNHYTVIFTEFSALKVSVIVINDSKQ